MWRSRLPTTEHLSNGVGGCVGVRGPPRGRGVNRKAPHAFSNARRVERSREGKTRGGARRAALVFTSTHRIVVVVLPAARCEPIGALSSVHETERKGAEAERPRAPSRSPAAAACAHVASPPSTRSGTNRCCLAAARLWTRRPVSCHVVFPLSPCSCRQESEKAGVGLRWHLRSGKGVGDQRKAPHRPTHPRTHTDAPRRMHATSSATSREK